MADARFRDETADQIIKTMRLATHALDVPSNRKADDIDRLCKEVLPDSVSEMIAIADGRAGLRKEPKSAR